VKIDDPEKLGLGDVIQVKVAYIQPQFLGFEQIRCATPVGSRLG
jgi:hypothetical protein